MTDAAKERVTFFAPAVMPDYSISRTEVMFGRGDPNDPRSDAYDAFASIPTPTAREHAAILSHLDEAAGGEPITRRNAAQVLGRAVELAAREK